MTSNWLVCVFTIKILWPDKKVLSQCYFKSLTKQDIFFCILRLITLTMLKTSRCILLKIKMIFFYIIIFLSVYMYYSSVHIASVYSIFDLNLREDMGRLVSKTKIQNKRHLPGWQIWKKILCLVQQTILFFTKTNAGNLSSILFNIHFFGKIGWISTISPYLGLSKSRNVWSRY